MAQLKGFGIADFYQTVTTRGLARSNIYRIKNIGTVDQDIFGEDTELLIYAQGGMIPNRNIAMSKVSFRAFDFSVPMNASYPESNSWSTTFYCDSEYRLRDITETWSRATFDEHKNLCINSLADVELVLLENSFAGNNKPKEMVEVRKYILKGCFPLQIGNITYQTSNSGDFATSTLNLAFQYVISENNTTPEVDLSNLKINPDFQLPSGRLT